MSGSFVSVRWDVCVHWLDLGLYSHLKEFWGNGVRTHVNSKGKIPSTGKTLPRGGSNPWRYIKQDSEPNTLPTSYSGPGWPVQAQTQQYQTPGSLATRIPIVIGMTQPRGVTVSMFAFLACHQCYRVGSSLSWGLKFGALVCSIFWNSSSGAFLCIPVTSPPSLVDGSVDKIKLKYRHTEMHH